MSIALIQRAIEWYGVDKKETILVGSTLAGLLSANEAGITSIHYSGMRGDRPSPSSLKTNPQFPFPSETTETRRLNIEIQRIVRSKPRTSVDIREGEKFIGPDPFPVADEA
jgi:beta-phosphoglucomutase-like phosphatase (HAD superfamily)